MTTKNGKINTLIHIFTGEGNTFTFHNPTVTVDNESQITFLYGSVSDGRQKEATFSKKRIVGYSISKV